MFSVFARIVRSDLFVQRLSLGCPEHPRESSQRLALAYQSKSVSKIHASKVLCDVERNTLPAIGIHRLKN